MNFGSLRPWGIGLKDVLEVLPSCVLLVDPNRLEIISSNAASRKVYRELAGQLPESNHEDALAGQPISILFPDLDFATRLSSPDFLPHESVVAYGRELLGLRISGVFTRSGRLDCLAITWSNITQSERYRLAFENIPSLLMMADAESLEVTGVNLASRETLIALQEYLKAPADNLLGKCIDQFHDAPEKQREMLKDPEQLPFTSVISIGTEKLQMDVAAMVDDLGTYMGPMLRMTSVTERHNLSERLRKVTMLVAQSTIRLRDTAETLASTARVTGQDAAQAAASAAEAANTASDIVTTAADLGQRTGAILDEVGGVLKVSRDALELAKGTQDTMENLTQSAAKIDEILEFTKELSTQTNLLSLNAAIEAARTGGEAGRAFQVVATEVKHLAEVTNEANTQITKLVSSIQQGTSEATQRTEALATAMTQLDGAFGKMSKAVESQVETSHGIAERSSESADGATDVSRAVSRVQQSSKETGVSAEDLLEASADLAKHANGLLTAIEGVF